MGFWREKKPVNRDDSQMLIEKCTDFITIPKFVYLKPCIEKKKKQSIIKVMWTKVRNAMADSPKNYNAVADVPHLYRWRGPCASDRVEHISPPASKHLGKKMPSAFSLNSLGVISCGNIVLLS